MLPPLAPFLRALPPPDTRTHCLLGGSWALNLYYHIMYVKISAYIKAALNHHVKPPPPFSSFLSLPLLL